MTNYTLLSPNNYVFCPPDTLALRNERSKTSAKANARMGVGIRAMQEHIIEFTGANWHFKRVCEPADTANNKVLINTAVMLRSQ